MQRAQTSSGSVKVSLVYGLIFGGIVGIIDIAYSAYLDVANLPFLYSLSQSLSSLNTVQYDIVYSFIVSIPLYVLLAVAFLLAGLFAARRTKRVSTGMLAGLWTGVLFLLIDLLIANVLLLYLIVFPRSGLSGPDLNSFERDVLTAAISYSIVAGLLLCGVGLGVGALGGLIGKGGTAAAQAYPPAYQPYQPNQPYQPYQPYPGQPYPNPNQNPYAYGQNVPPGQMHQAPQAPQAPPYANPNQYPQGQQPPPGQSPQPPQR